MIAPFFFVLGLPKSGTTWVQKALDSHPELLCRGEGKFMVFRKELSKAAVKYSDYLVSHQKKVFGEKFFPEVSRPEFDRLYRSFVVGRLIGDGVPEGVKRIGNKDPEHGVVLSDLAQHFPDAAFIHVIRDPRDVAVSTWHHMRRTEPGFVETIGDFPTFAEKSVKEWRVYVSSVRKVSVEKRLDYLEVRYEDLHGDGPRALRRLFAGLGVATDEEAISRCLEAASFERASGGRRRGQADAGSFYRKGETGDWRNHMDLALADCLLRATEGLAAELGYA
jgi:hypothetical protein